ncbi:MAG TPA: divergent polysaccharide deacetylase family protein [Holophaga sp.]|nr:divergent polysaccharide deacetylase family protein [Holophaga sp.]
MAARKGGKASTPRLLGLAALMFALGLGLGGLLTTQACGRKGRLPGDEEPAKPAPKLKAPGAKAAPRPEQPGPQEPAPAPKAPEPDRKGLPRLALVIDDLGYASPELVKRLCAQPIAFSVAVLPYQENTRESAEIAHDRGKEVMLHLPMEPLGYPGPGKDPGPDAVMYDLKESEIRARVRKALADVPFRKGVNNHMGSRITPDRARMTWVLEEIKARKCFFVDSRTEKDSVAFDVAEALGVPAIQRKVFLDDDKAFAEMEKQWNRALALAGREGQVVVIGHIYPETVAALEKLVPAAHGRVTFVKAGDLVK